MRNYTPISVLLSGLWIASSFVSATLSPNLANFRAHRTNIHSLQRRQPIDAILKQLEPATDHVPLVDKGLPLVAAVENSTVSRACAELDKRRSDDAKLVYFGAADFLGSIDHYVSSSTQVPICVFRPRSLDDLQLVMQIIHTHRIEFAIAAGKHTGQVGFSSTTGIHIDLRNINQIVVSDDGSYVDIGPGNVWDDIYGKLQGSGRQVLGGRVSGVGVGGVLTGGGGYSYQGSQYGLSSDSLLSVEVVLPNGTSASASKTKNPDLFFAVKGGGNQFGLVHNFRLKTFPINKGRELSQM